MKMQYQDVVELAKRRGIFWPSFEIYNGLSGFYDYGPIGSLIKDNIISAWKHIFIDLEHMAPIDSPNINPQEVLDASGHTKVFTDYITYCERCGEAYRADELIKKKLPDYEFTSYDDMVKKIEHLGIRCEKCGGPLTKPEKFNLMLSTKIGPGKGKLSYLRPETAQGIFINFPPYLRYFREKLPFGVVQVGKGFRNEISPRQSLLRLREFNMAEAEVFFDPENIVWNGFFNDMMSLRVRLLTNRGEDVEITLGEAMERGIIKQQPIAYFIGLTYRFLKNIGMDTGRIRFRQHHPEELAHYSKDCWDCEVETSNGWIEVTGIADRNQYDIRQHIEHSGADLYFLKKLNIPRKIKVKRYRALDTKFKEIFGKDWEKAKRYLESLDVNVKNPVFQGRLIPEDAYSVVEIEEEEEFSREIAWVIEPSFGIDRIILSLLEHSLYAREGTGYKVLKLKPHISPFKVAVLPLMSKDGLDDEAMRIERMLREENFTVYYDESGSIGKRYARADEIGVPYCITVDYQTLKDGTVTLRERDSTSQERIRKEDIPDRLRRLINRCITTI
ncbi:MAG: glycine--tRNA ligase [Thermoplasmata archaeon]